MKHIIIYIILLCLGSNIYSQQALKWNRTYGDQPFNYGRGVEQLADRGYIFLANQSGTIGSTVPHLIRTDSLGKILWDRRIGDTVLRWANDFEPTLDGGYILAGYIYAGIENGYDVLLTKTDSAGIIEWEKNVGGNDWDFAEAVIVTPDSAYLAVGKTFSYGSGDANIYLVKMNQFGDTIWTKVYGGDSTDFAVSADVTSDSNYIVAANTQSVGNGSMDALIMKISPSGNVLWMQIFGDTLEDRVYSIKSTPDKGFIFVGYTYSYCAINSDVWLMRFDSNYHLMWGLPQVWTVGAADDVAYNVSINDSSRFIISGYTTGAGMGGREMTIQIMGDYFDFRFSNTFGSLEEEETNEAIQTQDKGYILAGSSTGMGPSNSNLFVVKTAPDCQSGGVCQYTTGVQQIMPKTENGIRVFPNPSDGLVFIGTEKKPENNPYNISVYNISGKCILNVVSEDHLAGSLITIDLSIQAPGLYLVDIRSADIRRMQKIVIY